MKATLSDLKEHRDKLFQKWLFHVGERAHEDIALSLFDLICVCNNRIKVLELTGEAWYNGNRKS